MKQAKYVYLSIIVICLAIISACIYYVLGGFEPVQVYSFDGTTRAVIGKEYVIPEGNKTFYATMDSAKRDLIEGKLDGMLTAVIYQDESLIDSIRYFIGVSQDSVSGVVRMPSGYTYRQFKTDKIYTLFITQSGWVRPTPEEIEDLMQATADEEGQTLKPYTFELYYQDGSLSVEKWVR